MQPTTPYPESTKASAGIEAQSEKAIGGVDRLTSSPHDAVERAKGGAAMAAEELGVKGRQLMAVCDEWMDATYAYVREHPFTALGVALGAGYLLSRIRSR